MTQRRKHHARFTNRARMREPDSQPEFRKLSLPAERPILPPTLPPPSPPINRPVYTGTPGSI